jgi:hypothetical protein
MAYLGDMTVYHVKLATGRLSRRARSTRRASSAIRCPGATRPGFPSAGRRRRADAIGGSDVRHTDLTAAPGASPSRGIVQLQHAPAVRPWPVGWSSRSPICGCWSFSSFRSFIVFKISLSTTGDRHAALYAGRGRGQRLPSKLSEFSFDNYMLADRRPALLNAYLRSLWIAASRPS